MDLDAIRFFQDPYLQLRRDLEERYLADPRPERVEPGPLRIVYPPLADGKFILDSSESDQLVSEIAFRQPILDPKE